MSESSACLKEDLSSLGKVKFKCIGASEIDCIKELWELLNQHHLLLSPHFKQHYASFTFEERKKGLLAKAESSEVRVEIAVDIANEELLGYCISTVDGEKTGEIESIFIKSSCRGKGIGHSFMTKALSWMEEKGAKNKTVAVSVGNEQAFAFYGRYGLCPRKIVLEQV